MAKPTLCSAAVAADMKPNCANIITPGVEQMGVLINRADIESYTMGETLNSVTYNNIVSDITLGTGKTGYWIYQMGSTPFDGTNTALVEGSILNTFTHTVSFVILDNSPEVAEKVVDQLSNGEYVVVLQNKYIQSITTTGQTPTTYNYGKYQVYGLQNGLKGTAIDCEKWSDETNSGWKITLTETKATKSAIFYYNTDDTTTDAAFNNAFAPSV